MCVCVCVLNIRNSKTWTYLGQKRGELEDDLADEQDKSAKLEESVKELAAQVEEDEAKVAASVPR